MLPTNKDNQAGCTPLSSNCVIWQGPDIPCINLCKGDSISDVTAKLAEELCTIMGYLDIDTYDLSCFNTECPKLEDFHDLIQLIITKLCALEDCCATDSGTTVSVRAGEKVLTNQSEVTVASCFQFVNHTGDLVTTMTLEDYAKAIGTRVCALILDIQNLITRISSLENRVTIIETTCCNEDEYTPPNISSCVLGPNSGGWPAFTVLAALETAFCNLQAATGSSTALYLAIAKQCANLDTQASLANPSTNMGSLPGWVTQGNYNTVADALNNMWITICDLRAAVLSLADCCGSGCSDVELVLSASISGGNINLLLTGNLPFGYTDCNTLGSPVVITDTNGNSYTTFLQIPTVINGAPTVIALTSTPLNSTLDFTFTLTSCLTNVTDRVTCEKVTTYTLVNTITCPALTLTPTGSEVTYSFTSAIAAPVTYTVKLYNSVGTVLIDTITVVNPALGVVTDTFTGLTVSTTYLVRLEITYGGTTKLCPFNSVTTDPAECTAATLFNTIAAF
jgi:hypothetical protein